ncbi:MULTISPECIES: aspartyl/asparaginyl beta-hydroxylase domain-containing protein [Streptomyces]|uniref:Aspartyl/asparaginyl beta-hydroxylase domain-containing protein n=1 Tax=Streptomyces eurythermus TaxID=42237 RepID=A0ABW6ZBR7_9ACTN|nr:MULTISPECIES: aspartyl/asparaginyl beta-hydroxylase domain-containing protein [Streptomyces]QIS74349.1 aspartyl/asparaginyl beta-hydroxylase domain-containing protein [Streptomyces sp. DSM 40868]
MTPEIEAAFAAIEDEYGRGSIDRVTQMIDPATQNRHPLQKDAKWVMPGISRLPWHDPYGHPEIAPVVRAFEAGHAAIKEELAVAWAERRSRFSDYEHYLVRQDDWQALYLFRAGAPVPSSEPLVPTAYRILRETALDTDKLCPLLESHFSTLLPGASIAPHCDLWNFSINLHLAVDIPEGCGISVAGEARQWKEGECLLFDYSFEHEAWNHGTRPRTCLLVDLWHPETTLAERKALTVLVTEIRRLTGDA